MSAKLILLKTGVANIFSVANILDYLGVSYQISDDAADVARAEKIILPGVGSYGKVMQQVRTRGLVEPLREAMTIQKKPLLGICVGMQILSQIGYEFGEHEGLGVLEGSVAKIEAPQGVRLPHVGWNELKFEKKSVLFRNIAPETCFYFLHSYAMKPESASDVICTTDYGVPVVAAVERENIFGVQFHPEKSQEGGITLIRNFVEA